MREDTMGEVKNEFMPDYNISTGYVIKDHANKLGMSLSALSERTGITEGEILSIYYGSTPITTDIAAKLASGLGGTAEYWLKIEENYRDLLAKGVK